MASFDLVMTGDTALNRMLNNLPRKKFIRQAVVRPAREALKIIAKQVKQNSKRQHPQSRERDPRGSSIGPMARYVTVRAIAARSQSIGAKTQYNIQKFPRFAVTSRAGKRAFYPAAQEYGAKGAIPPIKPKAQHKRAVATKGPAAISKFRTEFAANYPKVVEAARGA